MKESESQIGFGIRFAFGIGVIVAAFLLPVHPRGPSRVQIIISELVGLGAVVSMAIQICCGRLWHRIIAGVLLIMAGAIVVGLFQEWTALTH